MSDTIDTSTAAWRLRHQLKSDHHPSNTVVVRKSDLRDMLAERDRLKAEWDALEEALVGHVAEWRQQARDEVEERGPSWVGAEHAYLCCASDLEATLSAALSVTPQEER